MNFGLALAGNRVQGTRVDLGKLSTEDKSKLIDDSLKLIVAGEISASTRETLMKQIDEANSNDTAAQVVGLILGTPEFQRQ
jgi:flagellar motor component MotA